MLINNLRLIYLNSSQKFHKYGDINRRLQQSYMVDEKNYFFDLPASNFNWVHLNYLKSRYFIIYLKLFKIKNNQLSSTNTTKLFTLFARKLFEKVDIHQKIQGTSLQKISRNKLILEIIIY